MSEEQSGANEADNVASTCDIPITERIASIKCASCGGEIDTSSAPSFSKVPCPSCGAQNDVPARFDHFTLLKRLGAGGMGTVFLAQDDALGRKVAVKMMQKALGSDPASLAVFRSEAQNAAKLNHPHVAQIYSFGEHKGSPYLEMELVPGSSLDYLISSGVPLDPAFVMRVGLEIADGLRAAEGVGLFHGDIKPDNILFNDKMSSKLVDFGIASMASQGKSNELWGTPYYISPEKVQKKKNSARSDIYSLGATLYHAIAGEPPYEGADAVAVIKARFAGPPRPLEEIRPDIEPEVARIIGRMMYNDLFMRYPNYGSLINDIKNYLAPLPAIRKQGPSLRDINRQKLGTTTGAMTAVVEASDTAEEQGGGRPGKKFVIQKGAIETQAAYSAAYGQKNQPTGMRVAVNAKSAAQQPVQEQKSGNSAKVALMGCLVFFVVAIVGAVGVFAFFLMKNIKADKQAAANIAVVKDYEAKYFSLDADLNACLNRMRGRDAEMTNMLAKLQGIYFDATGGRLSIPDLEPPAAPPPPPPAAAPAQADTNAVAAVAAADTNAVVAAAGGDTNVAAAAAGGDTNAVGAAVAEEAAPEPEPVVAEAPVEEAPAVAVDPIVSAAQELVYPGARSIRAALRKCEAIVATVPDSFVELKPGTALETTVREIDKRKAAYENRLKLVDEMNGHIAAADGTLKSINRGLAQISRQAEKMVADRKRAEELSKQEAAQARADAEKRAAEERAKAVADGEVARVRTVFSEKKELLERYDYDRIAFEMKRMERELTTQEAKEELKWTLERLERVKSLRAYLISDLKKNGMLRRGYRNFDILGLSSNDDSLVIQMRRQIPISSLTVADWMTLIYMQLEARPYDRPIGVIEHGDQLFNAAIFCFVHGGDSEEAIARANSLANMAIKKKSSLRVDAPKLFSRFEEVKEEDGATP